MIYNCLHIKSINSTPTKKIISYLSVIKNIRIKKDEAGIVEFSSKDIIDFKYLKKISATYSCTIFYSWSSGKDSFVAFSLIISNGKILCHKERIYNIFGELECENILDLPK